MNALIVCFFISISLSMDAFSLALIYGTYGLSFKKQLILSFIVSLFHFFMPLIGIFFGNSLINNFILLSNTVIGVIFGIIGLEMILSFKRDEEIKLIVDFFGYLFFGFTVSVDSLTVGIGLSLITNNYIMACSMFMFSSGLFTFLGLKIGNKINQKFGKFACLFGGVLMIFLAIYCFLCI